jgi:hypothetical protein
MSSITRRIEKLENMMSMGKERKVNEIIISGPYGDGSFEEQKRMESLGPLETWFTYQEQLAVAREDQAGRDNRIIVIGLSIERELQAREYQNLPSEEEKRAERIREYRILYKDLQYVGVALD